MFHLLPLQHLQLTLVILLIQHWLYHSLRLQVFLTLRFVNNRTVPRNSSPLLVRRVPFAQLCTEPLGSLHNVLPGIIGGHFIDRLLCVRRNVGRLIVFVLYL